MKTIEQEWMEFNRDVIPKDAGSVQRLEMKKAFFAGAYMALTKLSSISLQTNEDVAVTMIENLHRECRDFANKL